MKAERFSRQSSAPRFRHLNSSPRTASVNTTPRSHERPRISSSTIRSVHWAPNHPHLGPAIPRAAQPIPRPHPLNISNPTSNPSRKYPRAASLPSTRTALIPDKLSDEIRSPSSESHANFSCRALYLQAHLATAIAPEQLTISKTKPVTRSNRFYRYRPQTTVSNRFIAYNSACYQRAAKTSDSFRLHFKERLPLLEDCRAGSVCTLRHGT